MSRFPSPAKLITVTFMATCLFLIASVQRPALTDSEPPPVVPSSPTKTRGEAEEGNRRWLSWKLREAHRTGVMPPLRVAVPLLVTHIRYHGTSLLATTIKGWILKFLEPQGNIDLLLFHDAESAPEKELSSVLNLRPASRPPHVSTEERDLSQPTSYHVIPAISASYVIELLPTALPLPAYAQRDPEMRNKIFNDSSWLRCGCPPYCPAKRASVDYVQGTRWYTFQMFQERGGLLSRRFDYWIKLDVDIWMFRAPPFNFASTMAAAGAVFAHTGHAFNGGGCSTGLHAAIKTYCDSVAASGLPCPYASRNDSFWKQDDDVYYTNFVMAATSFGANASALPGSSPLALAGYLNERSEFFRHRWTDQSLAHKVFGVFLGPDEQSYALDWSDLRCEKRKFKRGACFKHGKAGVRRATLKLCTDI